MGKIYKNLISTTAGFNYPAQQPLDDREVVQSYSDLMVLVDSNMTYDGIEVYVVDDKKSYKLINSEWKAIATEDYVSEKFADTPISKGEGDYTDQTGYGTQAVGHYTSASGYNTIAGIKGYFYQNIEFGPEIFDENGVSTKKYGPCIITLTKKQPDNIKLAPTPEPFDVTKMAAIDLLASNWVQVSDNQYSQVVSIDRVAKHDSVVLQLTEEQLSIFNENGITLNVKNEDGVVKIYCEGQQPMTDYNIQVAMGYVVGDELTLTNDSKYPRCCKITGIDNNVITVDKLPFNSILNMEGDNTEIDGYQVFCPDKPLAGEVNLGYYAHAEGEESWALERASHAEGRLTRAEGQYSHVEGFKSKAIGYISHAEGYKTEAIRTSHAEGVDTKSLGGEGSHSEGKWTKALGNASHAEGKYTQTDAEAAHAEGLYGVAGAKGSHTEGYYNNIVKGADFAHAENYRNKITESGLYAHAEGKDTTIKAMGAHTEGLNTIASSEWQHVQGKYNVEDTENMYADIIGNGTGQSASKRKNIQTTDWSGNFWTAGDVYIGGTSQDDGELVATDNQLRRVENKFIDYAKLTANATVTYEVDKNETYMTANSNPITKVDIEDNNTFYYYDYDWEAKSNMIFPAGTYNITAKLVKRYPSRKITATIMDLEGNIIASSGEIQVVTLVTSTTPITSKSQFGDTDFGTFVLDRPWSISFKPSSGNTGMLSFTVTRTGDNPQILKMINNLHYYCNKDITYDESLFGITSGILTIDCSGITGGKLVIPYTLGAHTSVVVKNPENITKIVIPRGMNLVNETNMTDEDLVAVFANLNTIVRIHEDGAVLSFNIAESAMN